MNLDLIKRRAVDSDSENPYIRCQYVIPQKYIIYATFIDGQLSLEAEGLKGTAQPKIRYVKGSCMMEFSSPYPAEKSEEVAGHVKEAAVIAELLMKNADLLINNTGPVLVLPDPTTE